MNAFIALVAGALLGWITFSLMNMNGARGSIVSMVIGSLGAVMGSKLLTPLFEGGSTPTGDFSAPALLCAVFAAGALLYTAHMVHDRWDI
jgi:uncharacterized membrane protein YeaQ/YmgE (transglycosylase-associated protein family)